VKFSNHLDLEGVNRVTNMAAPVAASDGVRKQDLDSAVSGLKDKSSCRVATQGNLNIASPGATIDGITMVANDRVLVKANTVAAENGIYVWNGAAVAMTRGPLSNTSEALEQAITTVEEGTNAGTTWRQTSVNFVLGSGAVNWVPFGTTSSPATTGSTGTVTLATQSQVDSGPNSDNVVTVQTLRNWSGRRLKVTTSIGDGTATQFDVTHNFNTRDAVFTLRRNAAPFDVVMADIELTDVNTARIKFSAGATPGSNAFTFVAIA
jgi:hypothetical protein